MQYFYCFFHEDELTVAKTNCMKIGGSCYAHTVARSIQSCEGRIIGRYSIKYITLVKSIIATCCFAGRIVKYVLTEECTKLHGINSKK